MMLWRSLLRRDRVDGEWREEMESHIEILADAFAAQGMSPREARAAALKQAGNLTARREEIYRMNGIAWLDSLAGDARYALRGLRKQPSFTAVAALTLALGIGANTAVFTVVNAVLLKPLSYPAAERLVDVAQVAPGAGGVISRVSDGLLEALGVPPESGRPLTAADQVPGANETILLSHGYWERRFGGDRRAMGRKILVDGIPREIVGVMPGSFRIADTQADVILPLKPDRRKVTLGGFYLKAIARLKPGVSIRQADADLARLLPIWARSWPSIPGAAAGESGFAEQLFIGSWRIGPNIRPLQESVVGNVRSVLWVVMGTLAMVLLIACANVANLLLVRMDARRSELALRTALGASAARIVRQMLVESLLLSAGGWLLGLVIAAVGLRLLVNHGPVNLPRLSEIRLEWHALAFSAVVSLASGVVFGLMPVWGLVRPGISLALRDSGRAISHSRDRSRTRSLLVVVQVSLALVLLISSGLMIRSFEAMRRVRMGFERPETVQTFRIVVPETLAPKNEEVTRMEQAIAAKVAAIPGVRAAALASALPMDEAPPNWDGILKEGQAYAQGNRPPMRLYLNVSPGMFGVLGARIVAGRDLSWTDIYGGRKFVLVSENLARELWGGAQAAVGQRVRANDADVWREIVGVVEDVRQTGAQETAPAVVYWPIMGQLHYSQQIWATRTAAFAMRTERAGSGPLLEEIRRAVSSVNGSLAVANPETMQETVDRSMARTSFTLVMLAIAGSMALALGLIGIYGVIAYAVSQRTREIGIRLALGAEPADVRRMFVRYGLGLCLMGIATGTGAAAVLTRLMKSLLFGVAPVDPVTFAAVPVALLAATLAASYLPARRVSAVDPVKCMKAE